MTTEEQQSFLRWLKGIPYEIKFWESYYKHSKSLALLYSWSDYGNKCRLDNFDIQCFLNNSGAHPLMVDVGAALSYVLGNKFDNPGVELQLLDPLARHYNRILDDTGNNRQRLREGMIELLSTIYEPDSVDVVHVRNALDHCSSPMTGIFESLQVLRPGGVLYLHHHINEAERESYNGFHQFNIDCRDGNMILWNKSSCINVNEQLSEVADVQCSIYDNQYVIAVITKLKELPGSMYNPWEASNRATTMMNLTVSSFASPKFAFNFHRQLFFTGMAHSLMRRIPRKAVESIKSFIRSFSKTKA